MRRRKFDAIRIVNKTLNRAIYKYGWAVAPRKQRGARSFFDIFMDEITGAPKRR